MKFLFPTAIICFLVVELRDVVGFKSTTNTVTHRHQSRHCHFSTKDERVDLGLDKSLEQFRLSDIDDTNLPPIHSIIRRSIGRLGSGSDIRGTYVPHPTTGTLASLAHSIGQISLPALTPIAAHCIGFAFATMMVEENQQHQDEKITICIGRDPREHGVVLSDSFSRGASGVKGIKVVYTDIATTPALFDFCRSSLCHGGVMVTASHLPGDRNGFKFFSTNHGGFQKTQINRMLKIAQKHTHVLFNIGTLPPVSIGYVYCNEHVNWMVHYEEGLKNALLKQINHDQTQNEHGTVSSSSATEELLPLKGLNIVLNSGNGSGGFFCKVLKELGANTDGSVNIMPDPLFPRGIPNPENDSMIQETIQACEAANADIGILLDTDSDRCGLVAPRTYEKVITGSTDNYQHFKPTNYEPINSNRLIALIGVIYARQFPGCAIVTDSVTSNGLSTFLEEDLNLTHIRYLRGYANVIQKAKSVNEGMCANAEVAIETSGHCAFRRNDFLDDGTFTALKVLGLLSQERQREGPDSRKSILDLLSNLQELDEVIEFRLPGKDGNLESVIRLFDLVALDIETHCDEQPEWSVDRENLEGIRVSTQKDGGYFLLRKSLHDPVMCLQVEATSKEAAKKLITEPLLRLFEAEPKVAQILDVLSLVQY
mmetsp:Transcript_28230/g.31739  ORF Transcript_28230/g.31739 Transcript_28230/m.31739 type:complete len:653 (+) Transcript_28230:25-1983(+)